MTFNLDTTTQKSIEDKYDEEFSIIVSDFATALKVYGFDFTDDEYHEALTEALNTTKENRS